MVESLDTQESCELIYNPTFAHAMYETARNFISLCVTRLVLFSFI